MFRNFYGDEWSDFHRLAMDKDVYIFGWNSGYKRYLDMKRYACPWNICGILDNDIEKIGLKKIPYTDFEVNVLKPDELDKIADKDRVLVLICGTYIAEMAEQLEKLEIKNYFSDRWLSVNKRARYHKHSISRDDIDKLKHIMSDEKSKNIIDKIAYKRINGFVDYSDIYCRDSEYFSSEIWEPEKGGVFIDAGGFDGDTIEEYNDWTKNSFRRVYSFEPQKNMADKIENKLWKYSDKVVLIRKGLWSKAGKIGFQNGDSGFSGKIDFDGNNEIEVVALDDVIHEKVSFIKMDIEGAEREAIKGAEHIIKKDRPRLAISIYHLYDDLWEIPFLVHKILPEYKLSIRHYGVSCDSTILFAKLE